MMFSSLPSPRGWNADYECAVVLDPSYALAHTGIAVYYYYKEETQRALEDAFEQRDLWLVWMRVEPAFDNLRSDTRFRRLLERIGMGGNFSPERR